MKEPFFKDTITGCKYCRAAQSFPCVLSDDACRASWPCFEKAHLCSLISTSTSFQVAVHRGACTSAVPAWGWLVVVVALLCPSSRLPKSSIYLLHGQVASFNPLAFLKPCLLSFPSWALTCQAPWRGGDLAHYVHRVRAAE